MSFENVGLYAILEFSYIAPAGATAVFQTELPGNALAQRGPSMTLPASAVLRTIKFRLLSTTKGKYYRVIVTSTGAVYLWGGRVFCRPIGENADWAWRSLPISAPANTFTEIKLPIPPTSDQWTEIKLGIPPTSDTYSEVKLPIPPTSDVFTETKVPMHPTPELYEWLDVPVGA